MSRSDGFGLNMLRVPAGIDGIMNHDWHACYDSVVSDHGSPSTEQINYCFVVLYYQVTKPFVAGRSALGTPTDDETAKLKRFSVYLFVCVAPFEVRSSNALID